MLASLVWVQRGLRVLASIQNGLKSLVYQAWIQSELTSLAWIQNELTSLTQTQSELTSLASTQSDSGMLKTLSEKATDSPTILLIELAVVQTLLADPLLLLEESLALLPQLGAELEVLQSRTSPTH